MDSEKHPRRKWLQFRLRTLLLTGLLLTLPLSWLAVVLQRARGEKAKHSEHAVKTAERLREAIRSEIRTLGNHEWAGEYVHGDGQGVNVVLLVAPTSGCLFEWHGCLGTYDRNYGTVTCKNNRLRLSFTFPNSREGFRGIAEELIPVAWGDRRYLIPPDEVVAFCNAVNGGSEPRTSSLGSHLLRRGDEQIKVSGMPAVPKEFTSYLLAHPVKAEIIAVGDCTTRPSVCDWRFKDTPVTLNCGKNAGVLRGMVLHVVEPDNVVGSVKIKKVGETQSEAVMSQIGEDEPGPKVGWHLSTRWSWNRAEPDRDP